MKKISEILKYASCFTLSLMLMTSCDKEADKLEIETEILDYSGTFFMFLYATDTDSSDRGIFNVDIDTVPGNIKIDVSNEGYAIVNFVPGREIHLATPFFEREIDDKGDYVEDSKGNYIYTTIPMDVYENSPILKLYNAVNEDVNVTSDEKTELRKLLCEIKDTISISPFTTSRIPLIQQGASIASYDYEQNSYYSSYTIADETYSHKSSMTVVIKYVRQNLLSKMAADKKANAEAAIQKIISINSTATGKMNNTWGRVTLQYMNYYCDYDMRIESENERPNEMLVNISKILYGEDKDGNPLKNIWFLIEYTGQLGDSNFDWVEQKEE